MEGEGRDRVNMTLPPVQQALYEAVSAQAICRAGDLWVQSDEIMRVVKGRLCGEGADCGHRERWRS